jgi:hypothetical protein
MKKYTNKQKQMKRNYSRKVRELPLEVSGHIVHTKHGWKTLCVYGSPYDRGFAHGFLLYEELARIYRSYPFLVEQKINSTTHLKYIKICNKYIKPIVIKSFPEIYEELEGIVAGANVRGVPITVDFLLAFNSHSSLQSYFEHDPRKRQNKCSAFIATGSFTEDGQIVMGHTTHTNFIDAQMYNIVLFMIPEKGHPFVMQTAAGLVASVTDWFLCSTGIIGCETTISDINYKPEFGAPFFCRIRKAMQYGKTLDEYVEIMKENNAGDYACSWMFGDINTNEIMLCEIGLEKTNVQKTNNGVFYGMNTVLDFELRNQETNDNGWNQPNDSSGARSNRFNELLYDTYFGKISVENAKEILSDHYDTFLHKEIPNKRSICVHNETDDESKKYPYYMHGCTDGKVVNAEMAKNLEFIGRFGSACGRKFSIKQHIKKHPQYKSWEPYVEDFKRYPWTKITFQ